MDSTWGVHCIPGFQMLYVVCRYIYIHIHIIGINWFILRDPLRVFPQALVASTFFDSGRQFSTGPFCCISYITGIY